MRAEDQLAAETAEAERRAARPAARMAEPLIPAGARPAAAILASCCLVCVVVLGVLVAHQSRPPGVDRAVYSWLVGLHVPGGAVAAVSRLGGEKAIAALTAALALGCLAARRVRGAVLTVAGVAVSAMLTEFVLKPAVDRTITIHHYVTYPSGHTTGVFALTTALAVVLLSARPGHWSRAWAAAVVALAFLVSCAVGAAMVVQQFHYFTDTVAGAAVGTGVVIAMAFAMDTGVVRRLPSHLGR